MEIHKKNFLFLDKNIEQKEPFIYGQLGLQNFFEQYQNNKLNIQICLNN